MSEKVTKVKLYLEKARWLQSFSFSKARCLQTFDGQCGSRWNAHTWYAAENLISQWPLGHFISKQYLFSFKAFDHKLTLPSLCMCLYSPVCVSVCTRKYGWGLASGVQASPFTLANRPASQLVFWLFCLLSTIKQRDRGKTVRMGGVICSNQKAHWRAGSRGHSCFRCHGGQGTFLKAFEDYFCITFSNLVM